MSTIHRAGVTIAGLAAALTVGGAFVAQGYLGARQVVAAASPAAPTAAATTDPTLQPETVYVNPIPSASVIHVTQTAPPAANPPVIHVVVAGPGGDDGPGDD